MSTGLPTRRRSLRWLCALPAGGAAAWLAAAARAAPEGLPTNVGHADSSPQWEQLRARLFGDRPLVVQGALVQLQVPLRAAYGASVPVKVVSRLPQQPDRYVKRLTLLVDKNPSPVAAVMELTPQLGQADFETRLRVDEYSHIRVVIELNNGELHTDSRYVKVSGGCSAPPNRDQLHNIGKTAFKLPAGVQRGQPTPAEVAVIHPNDTGFELNQQTLLYIPPHFVRHLKLSYGGRSLLDAELDFSIAENPSLRFHFLADPPAQALLAEVTDSREGRYEGRLQLP